MDNTPGHIDAFERDRIRVVFFPPNCTSWKQPCDMVIIEAPNKRYKYLYLSDVIAFIDLDKSTMDELEEAGSRIRRVSARVQYGRVRHLLDAASCIKEILGCS